MFGAVFISMCLMCVIFPLHVDMEAKFDYQDEDFEDALNVLKGISEFDDVKVTRVKDEGGSRMNGAG